jgi:hypothetical protein
VGWGDWSQQPGVIRGHPSVPIKRMRNELNKHCDVIDINEYLTTKMCSKCEKGRCEGVWFPKENDEGVVQLSLSHQLIRCTNNECKMLWQRDKNSATNHLTLLMCGLRVGENRPSFLCPRKKLVLASHVDGICRLNAGESMQ